MKVSHQLVYSLPQMRELNFQIFHLFVLSPADAGSRGAAGVWVQLGLSMSPTVTRKRSFDAEA